MSESKKEQPKYIGGWQPSKEEQDIVDFVWDRFQAIDLWRSGEKLEEEWDKWEKQSMPGEFIRSADINIANPSKIKGSMTWNNIQTTASLFIDQQVEIQLIAQNDESKSRAIVQKALYDFAWEKAKGDIELFFLYMEAIKMGTAIWKEYYRSDTRKIKKIKSYDPATEEVEWKEEELQEYDDVYGRPIDIRSFFVDETASSMEDARDCFEIKHIPYDSLPYQYPVEKYPNIVHVLGSGGYFRELSDFRADTNLPWTNEDFVEIAEYWNKERDLRLIFANGVLLTKCDNPIPYEHKQLPYCRQLFFPRDRQHFYGLGVAEVLEHSQSAWDTMINIMVDREKLSLNKPMLKGGGEELGVDALELEPGKLVEVSDINNFRELNIQEPGPISFQILKMIEEQSKLLIGADDPMFGVKSGGTATENAITKESSLRKMKVALKLMEMETLYRLARLRIANIQQFYSQPVKVEKVIGTNWAAKIKELATGKQQFSLKPVYRKVPINLKKKSNEMGDTPVYEKSQGDIFEANPEDFMGMYEVRIKPISAIPVSKELQRKQWMEMTMTAAKIPQIAQLTDWKKITKEFYDKWELDGTDFMNDDESMAERMNTLATDENERMMNGENIPATQAANESHTNRHRALVTSSDFKDLDTEIQKTITAHYEGELNEQRLMQAQQTMQAAQQLNAPALPPPTNANTPPMPEVPPQQGGQGAPPPPAPAGNPTMPGQPQQAPMPPAAGGL